MLLRLTVAAQDGEYGRIYGQMHYEFLILAVSLGEAAAECSAGARKG